MHGYSGTLPMPSIPIKEQCVSVCWFVGLLFIGHTRFPTLRRCLRVAERAGAAVAGGPARAGKHAQREHTRATRAHAVQLLNEKIVALMPFKNKTVRARMLSYT